MTHHLKILPRSFFTLLQCVSMFHYSYFVFSSAHVFPTIFNKLRNAVGRTTSVLLVRFTVQIYKPLTRPLLCYQRSSDGPTVQRSRIVIYRSTPVKIAITNHSCTEFRGKFVTTWRAVTGKRVKMSGRRDPKQGDRVAFPSQRMH